MSVRDLVAELERAGVRLWEQDGRLHFRAPKGVMTDVRRDALRSQRDAVLDHLRTQAAAFQAQPHPEDRYQPFPLTDVQSAYLLGRGDAFAYGGVGCHGYGEMEFAELDPARLRAAWSALVRRHDMLRAVVDPSGWQQVLPDTPAPPVEVVDVRGAGPERFAAAAAVARDRLDHRVYQPGEWPLFALAVTRGDGRAVLHFSIDFLVADFVSIQILLAELQSLYTDPMAALPTPSLTFRDYLLAERQLRSGPRYERDRERWVARLEDLPPAPELPVLPVAGGPSRFRRHRADLDPASWAGLRERAGRHGVSPSVAVLAGYAEVIGRWSRWQRFTLDLTLLNRLPLHPDVDSLIGDFTSIDLLAVEQDPTATLADRARALQLTLWDDLDHRLFSGIEVLRELSRQRGQDAALMPVVFTSAIGLGDGSLDGRGAAGDAGGRLGYGISQTPQVWIDCQNIERDGGLASNWDVRDGVFPPGVVEAMVGAYRTLLARMASEDAVWSERCPVPLPVEQARRRHRYNDTAVGLSDALLHDGIVAQAGRTPDRVAVVDPEHSLTYGELLARAAAVAERLREEGVHAGDLVAVVLDKGCLQVVAVLGVLLAGGAYLPVDTLQPPLRRDTMLAGAGARVALTSARLAAGNWPDGTAPVAVDLTGAPPPVRLQDPARGPDDAAYVIYTSGSAGSPKGVVISHRAALNTVLDITDRFGVGTADVALGLANLGFDLSVYDIVGPLSAGGRLVLPAADRRGDPSHWADLVAEHGVTVWNSVPAQLQMLSDYLAVVPRTDLGSLRLAMLSGDWIPVALPDQVRGRLPGLRLVALGGATEAAIWSIWYPIEDVSPEWRSIPYGSPLTNQTIHVLDMALLDCPEWTVGELYIGGAGVAVGYLADEARTAQRFVDHPEHGRLYRTGDLGRMLPDGQVEFLGREDSQVKIRGHRIELAEIEAAIQSHPAVSGGAVLVHGDPPLEQRLAAFAEPAVLPARHPVPPSPAGLAAAAAAAGAAAVADVDLDRYAERSHRLDHAARVDMVDALRRLGVFTDTGRAHYPEEIAAVGGVADRHRRLVRRWVRALHGHGLLVEDPSGRLRLAADPPAGESERAWAAVTELADVGGDPAGLLDYFRRSAARLPELLRADEDPLRLLFPAGRFELSDALYRDALFNRWANRVAAEVVGRVAAQWPRSAPLRVLEVGAGSGGTSASVLRALRGPVSTGLAVDYLYTDLSRFFLNEARDRFADLPWVRFAPYDLDGDPREQGVLPNTVDLVVAGDVLHAGRHVDRVLRRLREVLVPGGWLVAVEMTRDHHQVMASLELLARAGGEPDPADDRHATLATFLTREQWLRRLAAVDAQVEVVLPEPGGPLHQLGMHVLAARMKTDRAWVDGASLTVHLAERLPEYMVPPDVQLVDALPLTDNGKLDRVRLRGWLPRHVGPAVAGRVEPAEHEDNLERRVAAVWAAVLRVEHVGREQNFFDLGGDSLLAAQLAGRLLEQVPEAAHLFFDQLLRLVLDRPTVATLVPRLADRPADAAPAAATGTGFYGLGGPDGAEQVVAVHGGSGTLAAAGRLVAALSVTARVSGLVVVDADDYLGHDPELLLDRVADAYARLLLDGLSSGPVRLVGAGFGGLVACELAGQLAEAGVEVAALVVIGAPAPPFEVGDELLAEWLLARELGADPVRAGFPRPEAVEAAVLACLATTAGRVPAGALIGIGADPLAAEAAAGFRELAGGSPADRLAAVAAALPPGALLDTDSGGEAAAERVGSALRMYRHSLAAAAGHVPRLYAGDVTLVLPTAESPLRPSRAETVALWSGISLGDVRVENVPGDEPDLLTTAASRVAAVVIGRSRP